MSQNFNAKRGPLSPRFLECLETITSHPDSVELAKHLAQLAKYISELDCAKTSVVGAPQKANESLEARITYLENRHAEEENCRDKMRGWEHEPDYYDDEYCSKADSLEREQSKERLGRL